MAWYSGANPITSIKKGYQQAKGWFNRSPSSYETKIRLPAAGRLNLPQPGPRAKSSTPAWQRQQKSYKDQIRELTKAIAAAGSYRAPTPQPDMGYLDKLRKQAQRQSRRAIRPHYAKLLKGLAKSYRISKKGEKQRYGQASESALRAFGELTGQLGQETEFGEQTREEAVGTAGAEKEAWRKEAIPEYTRQLGEMGRELSTTGGLFTGAGREAYGGAVAGRRTKVQETTDIAKRAVTGATQRHQQLLQDISRRKTVGTGIKKQAIKHAKEDLDIGLTSLAHEYSTKKRATKWERQESIEEKGQKLYDARRQAYLSRLGLY